MKKLEIFPTHLSDVENYPRAPSKELLSAMAGQFARDLDTLMNAAGRLGEKTEQYAQQVPEAAALFRKLSDKKVGLAVLRKLDG
jgi:hypothetical protein